MNVEQIIADTFTAHVRKQEMKIEGIRGWPEASLKRVFEYGMQRILNDACGAVPTKDTVKDAAGIEREVARTAEQIAEDCLSTATKVADNLAAGIIRAPIDRIGDPVKALAVELAEKAVIAQVRAQGGKPAEYATRQHAHDLVESDGAWMAQAKATLDAAKAIKVDIDLGGLTKKPEPKAKAAPTQPATEQPAA